ncbi:hypothetical protein EAF04_002731 [Stromatinia cepivora]|nr:hypothetical protein EAF04_002731 [Stromatinia cepivora]
MFHYQIDWYMEEVVGKYLTSDWDSVICLIRRLCRKFDATTRPAFPSTRKTPVFKIMKKKTTSSFKSVKTRTTVFTIVKITENDRGVQNEMQQNHNGILEAAALFQVAGMLTANIVTVNGVKQIDESTQKVERYPEENRSENEKHQNENVIKHGKHLSKYSMHAKG